MSKDLSIGNYMEKMKEENLSQDEVLQVLEKAKQIQDEKVKKEKQRKIVKNAMEDDFRKGNARNLPCPVCETKLKKCKCGFKEKLGI